MCFPLCCCVGLVPRLLLPQHRLLLHERPAGVHQLLRRRGFASAGPGKRLLATSGRLDRQPAEGSVVARLGDVNVGRAQRQLGQMRRDTNQRSVYLPILRNALPEMMRLFDAAEPSLIVGKRNETTVPTQALYLMNNPFVIGQAFNMAKRVMDTTESRRDGIRLAYELAYAREATDDEVSRAHDFLNTVAGEKDRPGQWTVLCQALLASAEFRYVD